MVSKIRIFCSCEEELEIKKIRKREDGEVRIIVEKCLKCSKEMYDMGLELNINSDSQYIKEKNIDYKHKIHSEKRENFVVINGEKISMGEE